MREPENIRAVESLGIDWMGFIFYPKSPRYVSQKPDYLPTRAKRVGVFVNAPTDEILRRVKEFGLNIVQLHGQEPPEQCAALKAEGLTIVKALSINEELKMKTAELDEGLARTNEKSDSSFPERSEGILHSSLYKGVADYFLFDTACAGYGGSGRKFNWSVLQYYEGDTPFLLSGGLRPDRLDEVLAFRHPRFVGIDLNSGFELSPGVKDVEALREFINKITNTETQKHRE